MGHNQRKILKSQGYNQRKMTCNLCDYSCSSKTTELAEKWIKLHMKKKHLKEEPTSDYIKRERTLHGGIPVDDKIIMRELRVDNK